MLPWLHFFITTQTHCHKSKDFPHDLRRAMRLMSSKSPWALRSRAVGKTIKLVKGTMNIGDLIYPDIVTLYIFILGWDKLNT